MSLSRLGDTRSRRALDHLLQTPDTLVWARLPGMKNGTAAVHASPAIGAGFVQYTAVLEEDGALGGTTGSRFVYVLDGTVCLHVGETTKKLVSGGFGYLPPGCTHTVRCEGESARIAVIEKTYAALEEGAVPPWITGRESSVLSAPLLGDAGVQVRALLPADAVFDFAVNTMEYHPGARLSQVEVHVMEHGLLMLEGEGIYRLGDIWYPVKAGDFIWMGPFCPQWFGALGDVPARYLIYKDWNRHPLAARAGTEG